MYRAICARTVLGMTAAAIALGVRDTAVVPYRRRAYARLTISRPYELMGLRSSADPGAILGMFRANAGPAPTPPHGGLHQAMRGMRRVMRGAAERTEPSDGDENL
jgi:hypothetical protein